ncbi:transcriptional regulator [Opitutaceae bacterium TAV1]|nr:transcriptional regulator [Opitutaceae bacterium TAV1]
MKKKQPTLQMIAEVSGMSLNTVSRALRGNPRQSAETRARIRKIAEEIGYRPNPMVSALMAQMRSNRALRPDGGSMIAFLEPTYAEKNPFTGGVPYLTRIFAGARQRAEALGYKLERFHLAEAGGKRMTRLLRARGILGVVLAPLPDPIPVVDFDWSRFACSTIGYSYQEAQLHRVVNDQFDTMLQTVRQLQALGYRRIGLAMRYEDDSRTEGRWTGAFRSARSRLPEERRVPIWFWHEWEPDGFDEWVKTFRPDAVITQHGHVRRWLHEAGRRVPDDVGLATLDIQGDQATFSGIDQNNDVIGATAVDLVVEQIHHNEYGIPARAKTVMIKGDWAPGQTTRPLPVPLPLHPPL